MSPYWERYSTNIQEYIPGSVYWGLTQTLNWVAVTITIKLFLFREIANGLNTHLGRTYRLITPEEYAQCITVLKRTLQPPNEPTLLNLLHFADKEWLLRNCNQNAQIRKDIWNMLST